LKLNRRAARGDQRSPEVRQQEKAMHRLTVLYPAKDGAAFNYDYYFSNHHKLVVSRLQPEGIVSCEFAQGVSDPVGPQLGYRATLRVVPKPRRAAVE